MVMKKKKRKMKLLMVMLEVIVTVALIPICLAQDKKNDVDKVTCTASPAHVNEGGWIVCRYPIRNQQTDRLVSVVQVIDGRDKHVLNCRWIEVRQCKDVKAGYTITRVTDNTLNVTITGVTNHHLGQYRCDMMEEREGYESEPCHFTISGVIPPSPQPQSSTTTTAAAAADIDQSDPDSGLTSGSIAAIAIGVIAVIAVIAVIVVVVVRRKRRCTSGYQPNENIEASETSHLAGNDAAPEEKDDQSENGSSCPRNAESFSEEEDRALAHDQDESARQGDQDMASGQTEDSHTAAMTSPKPDCSASAVSPDPAPGEQTGSGGKGRSGSRATRPGSKDTTSTKVQSKRFILPQDISDMQQGQQMEQVLAELKGRKARTASTSSEHKEVVAAGHYRHVQGQRLQDVKEKEEEKEEEEEEKEEGKGLLATPRTGL